MSQSDSQEIYEGTRLESAEDIRRSLSPLRAATVGVPVAPEVTTVPFRPLNRPPLALLCVNHDGSDDGDWVTLRRDRCLIGRADGDIVIPHDGMMSSKHAELTRKVEKSRYFWELTDLNSTNGTFVRVSRALLKHGVELLLGGQRFRFDGAHLDPAGTPSPAQDAPPTSTRGWQTLKPAGGGIPSLVELTPQGEGRRHLLSQPEIWIGRDPRQSTITLENDPMLNPRHARLARDSKNRWVIENQNSLNGLWLRVPRAPFFGSGQFQLGEQRFFLKLL